MKIANKGFFRETNHQNVAFFEAFFLNQKRRSATKVIEVFLITSKWSYFFSATIVLEVSLKVATKGSLKGKKPEKFAYLRLFF